MKKELKEKELNDLRQKATELQKQISDYGKENYQYLIGKYFRFSENVVIKVTSIDYVDFDDGKIILYFNSIDIFYSKDDIINANLCKIEADGYNSIYEDEIEHFLIDEEEFLQVFNSVVEFFKKQIKK